MISGVSGVEARCAEYLIGSLVDTLCGSGVVVSRARLLICQGHCQFVMIETKKFMYFQLNMSFI